MSGRSSLEAGDRARDVRGAAVEQIVAIDHREDDVLQLEPRDGPGHVLRLAAVDGAARVAGGDGAEAAAARADVAEEHDGRRPLGPALADVRAARLLAHGVEIEGAEGGLEPVVPLAARGAHLEPGGLGGEARGGGRRRGHGSLTLGTRREGVNRSGDPLIRRHAARPERTNRKDGRSEGV